MAKPAFIYAFDNLGPDRFAELCGLLLASRYKGFLFGGVGADGGIDGELDDSYFGTWQPESKSTLLSKIIKPDDLVVFQFKHKVTARVGQSQTRSQLLSLYKCQSNTKCELHSNLISKRKPNVYVLVTNSEVNSEFREKFIKTCKLENPQIEHYQIIGLDELETWIAMEVELRHLYFPTIFGLPRFNLEIRLNEGMIVPQYQMSNNPLGNIQLFQVSVLNIGAATSYVGSIKFGAIIDGHQSYLLVIPDSTMDLLNPKTGAPLEPGRSHTYNFPFDVLQKIKKQGQSVFLDEVLVFDEIGNLYRATISEKLRESIFSE